MACYCCGEVNATLRQIRQGLWAELCPACAEASIDRRGLLCPAHGRQVVSDVLNVGEPLGYPVTGKSGGKAWGLVRYDVSTGKAGDTGRGE